MQGQRNNSTRSGNERSSVAGGREGGAEEGNGALRSTHSTNNEKASSSNKKGSAHDSHLSRVGADEGEGGISSSGESGASSKTTSPDLQTASAAPADGKGSNERKDSSAAAVQSPVRRGGHIFRLLGGDKYMNKLERDLPLRSSSSSAGVPPPPSVTSVFRTRGSGSGLGGGGGSITPRMIVDNLPPIFSPTTPLTHERRAPPSSPLRSSRKPSLSQHPPQVTESVIKRGLTADEPKSRSRRGSAGGERQFTSPLKKIGSFFGGGRHRTSSQGEKRPQSPLTRGGDTAYSVGEVSSDALLLKSPLGKVAAVDQKPIVNGANTHFIEISCTRLFFPNVGETVTLPTVTAAPSTAPPSTANTPLHHTNTASEAGSSREGGDWGGEESNGNGVVLSPASSSAFAAANSNNNNNMQKLAPLNPSAFVSSSSAMGRAAGRGFLPQSFTAYDVENIIHLRAALGTTGGLISSDIATQQEQQQHSISASTTAQLTSSSCVGVVKRAAPESFTSLLSGHPLILYKVRSSASHAFACAPCFGMLQRYPGDTVNVLSPSDLLDGSGPPVVVSGSKDPSSRYQQPQLTLSDFDFAGVLSAVERASERLVVSIRHPSSSNIPPQFKTREIEKIRIEFVIVLDEPTKQEVKNIIRTSATVPSQLTTAANERLPSAAAFTSSAAEDVGGEGAGVGGPTSLAAEPSDGSPRVLFESPAAVLKSIQPVLAMLFEELKEKVPASERRSAAGDGGATDADGGGATRRNGAHTATPHRHRSHSQGRLGGGGANSHHPLANLKGPLLSFSGPSSSAVEGGGGEEGEGQGGTSRREGGEGNGTRGGGEGGGGGAVIKIGHADLTCFMGCGEELASYFPTRDRRDALFVHYASTQSSGGGGGFDLLTDEAFEKKYVIPGKGAGAVSSLFHPLPIPFGATITLKNMRNHQGNSHRDSVKSSTLSDKDKHNGTPLFHRRGRGAATGGGEGLAGDITLPYVDIMGNENNTTAPPTPHMASNTVPPPAAGAHMKKKKSGEGGGGGGSAAAAKKGGKKGAKARLARLCRVRVHFSIVLAFVIFVYSFVYCWRRID